MAKHPRSHPYATLQLPAPPPPHLQTRAILIFGGEAQSSKPESGSDQVIGRRHSWPFNLAALDEYLNRGREGGERVHARGTTKEKKARLYLDVAHFKQASKLSCM